MGEKFKEAEPKCVSCGKNEFKLTRMVDNQILAECSNCGEPHQLDARDSEGNIEGTAIQFWSPKMTEG